MTTRVAVMQPYLFPALSYMQLVQAADVFVFYDDARFSHGRWTHRNRVEVGSAPLLFTVPLENRGPGRALNEIAIDARGYDRWRRKFLVTIRQAYARAPLIGNVFPRLEALLMCEHRTLSDLAGASVRWLADAFGIERRWVEASAIDYDRDAAAQAKVLAIAERMHATEYVNMPSGKSLYDPAAFASRGMRLGLMRNLAGTEDGLDLSALHLLMHRSGDDLEALAAAHVVDWRQV